MFCHRRAELVERIKDFLNEWMHKRSHQESDGQVMRVCHKFGLVAAIGELGIASGILPWHPGDAEQACFSLFETWVKHRGGTQAHETKQAEQRLRTFIAEHGNARFESMTPSSFHEEGHIKTTQRAGFKRKTKEGHWEYLMLPDVFDRDIVGSLHKNSTKKHLAQCGLVIPDAQGKFTVSCRIPGYGQMRLYHIASSVLNEEVCRDHV